MAQETDNIPEWRSLARIRRETERRVPLVDWRASRRAVLKGGLATAAGLLVLRYDPALRLGEAVAVSIGGGKPLIFDLVRPDDFLRLRLLLTNLALDTSVPNQPKLVRIRSGADALVVVEFPPQSLAEQALIQADPVPNLATGIDARLAGTSRLAFLVPPSVQSIPFDLGHLLDWNSLLPSVVDVARAEDFDLGLTKPTIRAPNSKETAVEAMWWLLLSPGRDQAWVHATQPVVHGGRTEIWHTRLASQQNAVVDEDHPAGVRAVWAQDLKFKQYLSGTATPPGVTEQFASPFVAKDGMPFRMVFTPKDRLDAVRNTSDYSAYDPSQFPSGYLPAPFRTERLMLSALGAWVDLDGAWPDTPFNSLIEWRHRATGGRDHFVRIVRKGHLHPFGHRAVMVIVGERKFRNDNPNGVRGAYLTLRGFIVITQRVRTYPASFGLPHEGRGFPFQALEAVTQVTPDFGALDPLPAQGQHAWQPLDKPLNQGGVPILATFRGTDWEGNSATFSTPFVFIEDNPQDADNTPFNLQIMQGINAAFEALDPSRRTADLGGQKVAVAPPSRPGNSSLPVDRLILGAFDAAQQAGATAYRAADQLAAFPSMLAGEVKLPTLEHLAGTTGLLPAVRYPLAYLQNGFDPQFNKGEAFLELSKDVQSILQNAPVPIPLPFATENAGGLATPSQALSAITRELGPVAGQLQDVLDDKFKPDQVFQQLQQQIAKLLGAIPLKDILEAIDDVKGNTEKVIKYIEEKTPDELVVRFEWKPDLKKDPVAGIFVPRTQDPKAFAVFEGEAHQGVKDPNKRSWRFHGEITNFTINLLGDGGGGHPPLFLHIDVAKVAFTSASGQKTQVDVKVNEVAFDGALKFVNELRKYLPAVSRDLEPLRLPTAITAWMTLPIPAVTAGVFSLTNLRFRAEATVALTGEPFRVRFAFSSRENPFTLAVSGFGGGGFFAIALGLDGVEQLEIAFDFGGTLALDVGVAQGGVEALAGIYFKLAKVQNQENVTLEGFLKLHGFVQVLGIVAVEIVLDLSFQYVHKSGPPEQNIVTGRAKLMISIEILFFSVSVTVDVEKSFGGDPKDPTFAQAIGSSDWAEYAAAFATV